jgi:hypothetical protein
MIHQLMPWALLTRTGIPALKVARRAIEVGEVTVQVGETLNPELFPLNIRAQRLRQFYEMRRLEPVDPAINMQQYHRERFERLHGGGMEVPVQPVMPVAARVVAEEFPTVDVPVDLDDLTPKRKTKGAK